MRPALVDDIGHDSRVLGVPTPRRLDLEHQRYVVLLAGIEHVGEERHRLVGVGTGARRARAQARDLGTGHHRDQALAIGRPVDGMIVHEDRDSIQRHLGVDLDPSAARLPGTDEGGDGVFRVVEAGAAMGDERPGDRGRARVHMYSLCGRGRTARRAVRSPGGDEDQRSSATFSMNDLTMAVAKGSGTGVTEFARSALETSANWSEASGFIGTEPKTLLKLA